MPDKSYPFFNFPESITEMYDKYRDHAESYKNAIDLLLVEQAKEVLFFSERDILPILATINQYIELMLKAIILKQGNQFSTTHKIKDLINQSQNIQFSTTSQNFIDTITRLDQGGYAFRYPTDKDMQENFTENNPDITKGLYLSKVVVGFSSIKKDLEELYNSI